MTGKEKIPILLAEKSQDLLKLIIPKVTEIVTKIGIENIGQPDVKLPDICLPASEIQPLIDLRNNIVDKLNSASKIIETLTKPLNPLNTVVTVTSTVVDTLNTSITVLESTIPLLPTPTPGAPSPAGIALNVKSILEKTLAKTTPKITTAKNSINSITEAVDKVNSIISTVLNILNSIDKYLIKCKPDTPPGSSTSSDLIPLNSYLTNVANSANQVENALILGENYNGFILDVVEEQYSPTIKKSKAVAKNSNGIILLQTPLSFTTTPQILIEELKLIIDKNNLKAN
jgi:hypothetical protein